MTDERQISKAVISRLPRYYRYLGELMEEGIERISSNELSARMKVTASQIRQDLNNFGGFGQQVLAFVEREELPVTVCIAAVPDQFVGHGSVAWQREQCGLDAESVADRIRKRLAESAGRGRTE